MYRICLPLRSLYLSALLVLLSGQLAYGDHLSHKLRAVTLDYPPYEYPVSGVPKGLAVEVLQEAVKRAGEPGVDVKFFPWKRAVREIQFGDAQVIFNAGKNKARQEWGTYSRHVLILQKYYLFKRKGEKVEVDNDIKDVNSYAIGIRRGYLYGSGSFKQAIVNNSFKEIYETDSTASSLKLLLGGRIDMFVGDYLPVMTYLESQGLRDKVDTVKMNGSDEDLVVLTWPTYFLFSKKNLDAHFVDHFDHVFDEMIEDGTYQKIVDKYLQKFD